jgi:hypothetical protein
MFAVHASSFIDLGYSPLPRNPRGNHPAVKGWPEYCERTATREEIIAWARIPLADVCLACGFNGLVAVDLDDDRPGIAAAIRKSFPHWTVARRGSKGYAWLLRYEGDAPPKSFNIYRNDDKTCPLIEIKSKGSPITVPPSDHAKTRRPYVWWHFGAGRGYTGNPPPLKDLPVVTDADLEELRRVVSPWAAAPREERKFEARKRGASQEEAEANRHRYGPYAAKALQDEAANVATLQKGSRNRGLFDAVCRIGWAVHHDIITEAELADAFMDACKQNGLLVDDGRHGVLATISSGLRPAQKDPLPELKDRPFDKGPNVAPAANDGGSNRQSLGGAQAPKQTADGCDSLVYRTASTVKMERISWLWRDRIPHKRLTVLTGAPAQGKSQITCHMAAVVTNGDAWPDGAQYEVQGDVIFLSAEDAAEDTIVPRLKAVGANLDRVHILEAIKAPDPDGIIRERLFSLAADIERLEKLVLKHDVKLVIIDPVSAYMGKADGHSNTEVRGLLAPLADLAKRRGVTVVAVTHDRKGGGKASERTIGSVAFTAAPRAVWAVTPEKDEDDTPTGRFILTRIKGNLAPDVGGLAYEIEEVILPSPDFPEGIKTSRIKWHEGAILKTADELYDAAAVTQGDRGARQEAEALLRETLAGGPKAAKIVIREAREAAISDKVLRTARERLGIKPRKDGLHGGWIWALPGSEDAQNAQDAQDASLKNKGNFGGFGHLRSDGGQVFEGEL